MKLKFIFLIFFNSCALTLISPGVNSNFRLKKIVDIRFEEAHFYGIKFYQHSSFYIEKEFFPLIVADPNNLSLNKDEKFPSLPFSEKQVYILFENCYDKDKIEDPFLDINSYRFYLNKQPNKSQYSYFYPYSYQRKGTNYLKRYPFIIKNDNNNSGEFLKTGEDFWACIRTLVNFEEKNIKKGINSFQIITSNKSIIDYSFEFEEKFVYFDEEPRSYGVK